MKIVTSAAVFNDAVGTRMSITFTEIDENGIVIDNNKRVDRILTNDEQVRAAEAIKAIAQSFVDDLI